MTLLAHTKSQKCYAMNYDHSWTSVSTTFQSPPPLPPFSNDSVCTHTAPMVSHSLLAMCCNCRPKWKAIQLTYSACTLVRWKVFARACWKNNKQFFVKNNAFVLTRKNIQQEQRRENRNGRCRVGGGREWSDGGGEFIAPHELFRRSVCPADRDEESLRKNLSSISLFYAAPSWQQTTARQQQPRNKSGL